MELSAHSIWPIGRARKTGAGTLILILLTLCQCGPREVTPNSDQEVPIRMLRVINPALPSFSTEQIEIFLAEAQRFAAEQLDLSIRWIDLGEVSVEQFFRRYYPVVFPENRTDDPFVLDIIDPNPAQAGKLAEALVRDHGEDSFVELREFARQVLPPTSIEPLASKEALLALVARYHLQQLSVLAALPAPTNGEQLLLDPAHPYHQYVYWDAALERVRRYDFILTNQILASAETLDASIHTSLRGGITTGLTERSRATYGGTVLLSTYPVIGSEAPLARMRGGDYGPEEAARYLGGYSTHEFGHLFLHIGHPYDHPACVMNPARALRYREWYEDIVQAPQAPACQEPHVAPHRDLFLGDRGFWERGRDGFLRLWDRLSGN